ncbi:MAG: hemolysin III family protein [Erysipelotrichaceae bacterium]|nr:hemolysin III family protein [Erysipelotrichaceae bacterium]
MSDGIVRIRNINKQKTMHDMFKLSFGEEVGNAVSHGVMAIFYLVSLPIMALYSYGKGGMVRFIGISIFMICMFLMFVTSTLYHSMPFGSNQKYVLRKMDHIMIYLAIAGSFTPVALCGVEGWLSIFILVLEWGATIFGIFLKSLSKKAYPILTTTIYLVMGWSALLLIPSLIHHVSSLCLLFVVMGGIMYSLGVIFYSQHKKYFHFIWHLFIIVASTFHFIAFIFLI